MSKRKIDDSLANLSKAMDRLREALEVPRTDPLVVEGTIQRFEFVIEIFWKALKRALEYEGIVVKTPRESLKQAFAAGWLSDEPPGWICSRLVTQPPICTFTKILSKRPTTT